MHWRYHDHEFNDDYHDYHHNIDYYHHNDDNNSMPMPIHRLRMRGRLADSSGPMRLWICVELRGLQLCAHDNDYNHNSLPMSLHRMRLCWR
jgi:hypothetical protein